MGGTSPPPVIFEEGGIPPPEKIFAGGEVPPTPGRTRSNPEYPQQNPGCPWQGDLLTVPGADWLLLALATVIYVYGGAPFLRGFVRELRVRTPGMMTLVAVAITVAYVYSAATVFGSCISARIPSCIQPSQSWKTR